MKYKTKILQVGNLTAIEVPKEIVEAFNSGKRPPVVVKLKGYSYRSTVAVMGGQFLIPLRKEHRINANVTGGESIEIELVLDKEPRVYEVPEALKVALKKDSKAQEMYDKLPPGSKGKVVQLVNSAKAEATRERRIEKILIDLKEGKKF